MNYEVIINTIKNNSIVNKKSNILTSCSEIEIHYKRPLFDTMPQISSAEIVNEIIRKYINLNQIDLRECMWLIHLTTSNRVLGISEVASGSTRGVQLNSKYIFQLLLLSNSSAFILVHNHPSGNLTFSNKDIKETKKMKRLAKHLEIVLHDHLIISSESFLSMAEQSLL